MFLFYAVIICLYLFAWPWLQLTRSPSSLGRGSRGRFFLRKTPKTVHKYTYTFMEETLKSSIMWKCFEKERMFDSVALQCTGENQDNLSIIQHSTMLNLIVVTFLHSFSHKSLIVKIYFVTCALTSQCWMLYNFLRICAFYNLIQMS